MACGPTRSWDRWRRQRKRPQANLLPRDADFGECSISFSCVRCLHRAAHRTRPSIEIPGKTPMSWKSCESGASQGLKSTFSGGSRVACEGALATLPQHRNCGEGLQELRKPLDQGSGNVAHILYIITVTLKIHGFGTRRPSRDSAGGRTSTWRGNR